MKRFWKQAAAEHCEGGWRILLDGKSMRLPGGLALLLPDRRLAEAIAREWDAAADVVDWNDLPLTRLAGAARQLNSERSRVTTALVRYAETDCLCYRADYPPELVALQSREWQPWLDWAASRYGARLRWVAGILAVPQESDAVAALSGAVAQLDCWQLAALAVLVPAYGSLVLGLAVVTGTVSADEALRVSLVDETFQQSKWGLDHEAAARHAVMRADVGNAERFMQQAEEV